MSDTFHTEPVNLLACDGGGIRGVSELVILDEVMRKVQEKGNLATVPKPCEFFHLLAGTSTGGLVAIMLGRLEMSTEQALNAYDAFASEIFSRKNKNRFDPTEKYCAKALEKSVQRLVQDHGKGSLMRDSRPHYAKGRAFICTMPLQDRKTTVRLRTYDVDHDKYSNCLIYEAARATTAATTFFRPMTIKDDQGYEQKFADAALGRNNPITLLPEEAISLYGTRRRLGCVVSLGTGSRTAELVQPGKGIRKKSKEIIGLFKVMKEITTDTQRDHENMVKMFKNFPGVYFRLDVDGGAEGIRLDQWEKIDELKARTRAYLQRPEVKESIEDLAETLLNGNPHGLNIGHLGGLDKDIIVRETQTAKPRGMASTIFTGREAILKRLRAYFLRDDSVDRPRKEYHLWGMGGVGKTQIALKFAEECERNSLKIFWVDATDSVTIKQSYLRIAERLLPTDQQGPEAVQKILEILETSDRWLLVFDNAPGDGLAQYMPDGSRGNIIYTSRQRNLERRILPDCRINVNEMEVGDATTLLLRSARMATDTVENRDIARHIAKELGFLPLALDQAGAYIHMDKCPITKFMEKFNEQKDSLLRNPKYRGEDHLRNLPVYATFNISYEAIKAFADKRRDIERAPEATYALQLLHLLCFYHNEGSMGAMFNCAAMTLWLEAYRKSPSRSPLQAEGVSLAHFVQMLHHMEGEEHDFNWQSQSFDLGIAFLEEFSLVKYDYSKLYSNMHVLVHEWARGRMDPKQRAEWGLAARRILIDSLPETDSTDIFMHRRQMLPHVDACMKYVRGYDYDLKLESKYLYRIAALYAEADRPEAETAYLRSIRCAAAALGYLDELTLQTMLDAADYYVTLGRDYEAEALYLETIDRVVIMEDEKRWRASQEKLKQKSRSKPLQVDAKARPKEALDSWQLRNAKVSLAQLYLKRGNLESAEQHSGDVLGWARRFSKTDTEDGEEDDWVRRARDVEAGIKGQKPSLLNLTEANRLYLEAKEARGPDDSETIWRQKVLVHCLQDENKWKEAEYHLFILQSWSVETHGAMSTEALDSAYETGYNFRRQHRPWEAVWLLSDVMLKFNEKFGPYHPKTVNSVSEVAQSFFYAGMFETAIEMGEECYNIRKQKLGDEDRRTRYAANQLQDWKSVSATMPLFHRLRWVQGALLSTKIALAEEDAYSQAPPWLVAWEPVPIEPMLTADGTEARFTRESLRVDTGTVEVWRQLDEAVFVPEQSLLDVVPAEVARFAGDGWWSGHQKEERESLAPQS